MDRSRSASPSSASAHRTRLLSTLIILLFVAAVLPSGAKATHPGPIYEVEISINGAPVATTVTSSGTDWIWTGPELVTADAPATITVTVTYPYYWYMFAETSATLHRYVDDTHTESTQLDGQSGRPGDTFTFEAAEAGHYWLEADGWVFPSVHSDVPVLSGSLGDIDVGIADTCSLQACDTDSPAADKLSDTAIDALGALCDRGAAGTHGKPCR